MTLFNELKRRNVLRMVVLYAIAAWLILQVAEVLIDLAKLPDWVGTTTLGLLAVGFPIALVLSWFYEITPEGVSLEKDVDRAESITHVTGRRLDFIVISLLCAAVIMFAYDKWWIDAPLEKSIAVLAFTNMSGDPEQEYFSDGISEELLNLLAQIKPLKVIARTSSFSFKDQNVDIATVAEKLNVRHVLEGSVRRSGNQVRITAQLIDATDSTRVWSQIYDRELENIFAVQDEIAVAIVGAMKEHLGLQVEVASRVIAAANTEAHDAYLRGRYLVVQRTRATVEGAVREFEKAVEFDPDYALAHAELALANLLLIIYGELTITEAIARAEPHVERAVALDPTLAESHAATGMYLWNQFDLEEALTHFEQAIQINPNYAIVYNWMGIILGGFLGRYEEFLPIQEKALQLDPLSIPSRSNYVSALIDRNRLAEAERELEKLASIAPRSYAMRRADLTSLGGNWANAALGYLDALQIDPQHVLTRQDLALRFAMLGLEPEALAMHERPLLLYVLQLLGRSKDGVAAAEAWLAEEPMNRSVRINLGMALAAAGDYARARPILEEMWQSSGRRVTCCGLFYEVSAAALIAIRRDAGEETEVGELVAAMKENVRHYREGGVIKVDLRSVDYEAGLVAYLAGDRERGLALIAKCVEDGFFIPHWEVFLHSLYDDPGFAPIRASQEARRAHEREKFLATVCTDNPYAAVWQPAEETCEQFAAAGGN